MVKKWKSMKHLQPFCELTNTGRTKETNVVEHKITHREMIIIVFQLKTHNIALDESLYTERNGAPAIYIFLWS